MLECRGDCGDPVGISENRVDSGGFELGRAVRSPGAAAHRVATRPQLARERQPTAAATDDQAACQDCELSVVPRGPAAELLLAPQLVCAPEARAPCGERWSRRAARRARDRPGTPRDDGAARTDPPSPVSRGRQQSAPLTSGRRRALCAASICSRSSASSASRVSVISRALQPQLLQTRCRGSTCRAARSTGSTRPAHPAARARTGPLGVSLPSERDRFETDPRLPASGHAWHCSRASGPRVVTLCPRRIGAAGVPGAPGRDPCGRRPGAHQIVGNALNISATFQFAPGLWGRQAAPDRTGAGIRRWDH